jgi:3',5'-cyclic-AMP phosphodiesterase
MIAPNRLTRRELLRLGAGSLLAAGFWPGALGAADVKSDDFHFLVVNDTHCIAKKDADRLERVVKQMKAHDEKPVLCLHLGDLSDHGKAPELGPVRDVFKTLGVPVHYVPGNHDYLTADDRKAYDDLFPEFRNYHFDHGGWQFVGIDSTEGKLFMASTVQKDVLKYLDDALPKLDKMKPTILFTHFPLGPRVL